jgi:hypothetical protein
MKGKPNPTLGLSLFFLGVLIGLLLFGSLTWADLESNFYFGYGVQGSERLKLSCPLIMTAAETNQVKVTVPNVADKLIEPRLRASISNSRVLVRTEDTQIQVEPGSKGQVSWEMDPQDIVFGHLIMVSVYQFQTYKLPSADGKCGVLVLKVPGSNGMLVYYVALLASLALMGVGLASWSRARRPLEGRLLLHARGLTFLAGVIVLGIVVASLGAWLFGVILAALSVLSIGVMLGRFVMEGQ